jgi:uncharacterized protein (TIGR03437 family)
MNQLHVSRMLCFTAVLCLGTLCPGQQNIVATYTQNFDSMGPTGTTPPPGWTVLEGNSGTNNGTWTGNITANGPNSVATIVPTTGPLTPSAAPTSTNNNGFNAQGDSASDRVLATSPTGFSGSALELDLTNASGSASNGLIVSYDIRRFTAVSTPNELPGYQLFYSVNGGAWVNVPSLNPTIAGPSGVVVPNTVGVTNVPPTTFGLATVWQNGQILRLRWVDDNAEQTSPDQIQGLDNVVVSLASPGPIITSAMSNYSYTPAVFPNSGIAQGALFVITGTGLADPAKAAVLQDSTQGLPTTLNGSSVQVTSGTTTLTPAFYYTSATQLALVLPSNTPLGTAQITVSYGGQTSAPYSFQVVQTAPGFASYDGTGTGLGAALNPATFVPYSYANSIPPGTTVVLYGSGLGADAATDTKYVAAPFNINNLAHVYVGGVDAPIPYQGSFDYPGLNQVNVTIPASAPTGCNVSVVGVTAAGTPTNFMTLPIGNGPCSDPAFGINANLLLQPTVKTAVVGIALQPPGNSNNYALAEFAGYNGSDFPNFLKQSVGAWPSLNGCVVSQSLISPDSPNTTGLDGGSVSVSGPAGSTPVTVPGGVGDALLPSSFFPATGANFAFQGFGGLNVGSFMGTLALPTTSWTWTNPSAAAAITRSAGLSVTWSGGGSNSYVQIYGSSAPTATAASGTLGASANFSCTVPASAGQFTVPPYVLAALPAGPGYVFLLNENNFTALGATGVDWAPLLEQTYVQVNSVFN